MSEVIEASISAEQQEVRTESLPVTRIRTDGGTQARAALDRETVKEYAEARLAGADFPPVIVFYDGEKYWLADGFHRVEAARQAEAMFVEAEIRQGTQRDAILFAAGANAHHGLRRSNADKWRAVERLLVDEEWGKWSDREIARRCHVSAPFVAQVRSKVGSSDRPAYAPPPLDTVNIYSMEGERTYIHPKTGKPTKMDTTNIGRNGREDNRDPVPFPDPVPEARDIRVDRDFLRAVKKTHSADRIGNGEIKRPFAYDGKLYVCMGGGSNTDGVYEYADRVVPITDWPGRPYTMKEVRERKAYGPCYYFGIKVVQGSKEFILDPRDRIRFLLADEAPEEEPANHTPVWQLQSAVARYLDSYGEMFEKTLTIEDHIEVLSGMKTHGYGHLLSSGILPEPYRKRDVVQAVNNVLEQMRQKQERRERARLAAEARASSPVDDWMPWNARSSWTCGDCGQTHEPDEPVSAYFSQSREELLCGLCLGKREGMIGRRRPGVVEASDSPVEVSSDTSSDAPTNILHSSESNEYYTPAPYVEAVRRVMGAIDLDPASCALANETVQAETFYTVEEDGFEQEWRGRVFLNPPYGKDGGESNQGRWSHRLIEAYKAGNVDEAILLVNATPGNRWWAPLWDYPICFPDHRIHFDTPEGATRQGTHSNAFVYLGPYRVRFEEAFRRFGPVVVEVVKNDAEDA